MHIEPEAVIRFNDALKHLGVGNGRVLLAVSGGPDSLAMLIIAHAAIPDRIMAATIDHRLRPEAADEAEFVASVCIGLGVAHHILVPDRPISGSLQLSARAVRYELLDREANNAGCELIATAHHQDDQLETLLMRVARGSGVDGLSGIRRRNGRIIRPLLGFSKSELERVCTNAGIEPVRDPSNDDSNFDRVAMRQFLAAKPNPFDPARASRTASALADASEALDWTVEMLLEKRTGHENGCVTLDANDLPRELQRRMLLAVLGKIEPEIALRGESIERLMADLKAGKTSTIGGILCKGGSVWQFSPAPPRRSV